MNYRLVRNETRQKPSDDSITEIFVCLEMDDGVEYYPFGYWLTQEEVASVLADAAAMDGVLVNVAARGERAFNEYKAARSLPDEQ